VRFYPFDEINQAIADAHSGACVKAVLRLGAPAN
jgi:Zn-dependent alcohol dehydrogenase